ncbi:hypothetical protein ACJX0J_040476 [Zea mays]
MWTLGNQQSKEDILRYLMIVDREYIKLLLLLLMDLFEEPCDEYKKEKKRRLNRVFDAIGVFFFYGEEEDDEDVSETIFWTVQLMKGFLLKMIAFVWGDEVFTYQLLLVLRYFFEVNVHKGQLKRWFALLPFDLFYMCVLVNLVLGNLEIADDIVIKICNDIYDEYLLSLLFLPL